LILNVNATYYFSYLKELKNGCESKLRRAKLSLFVAITNYILMVVAMAHDIMIYNVQTND